MYEVIPGFLGDDRVAALRGQLDAMEWEDGLDTARSARNRKRNLQLTVNTAQAVPLLQQLVQELVTHPPVLQWAEPRRVAGMQFARYDEGMFYGSHNDAAIFRQQGLPLRADISFTVFLEEPADYDGGELVLETAAGEVALKEAAGSLVLYDTGLTHRVETVTRGQRLVIVGWIESMVRSAEARGVLRDLNPLIRAAMERDPDGDEVIGLRRVRASLMRLWAET